MKIIEIAGVQFVVSREDYDYYWKMKNTGDNSDAFKTACRRLLGLGPKDHCVTPNFIRFRIRGGCNKELCIQKILNSGLIEYEEEWCKNKPSSQLIGAAYTTKCEQAINGRDDEFEDELNL